jgi:hypothetical protein
MAAAADGARAIVAHLAQVAVPGACSGEAEDSPRLDPPHEVLERALDGPRIGPFAAQPDGLLEELLIKHKIRAFHVYSVQTMPIECKVQW